MRSSTINATPGAASASSPLRSCSTRICATGVDVIATGDDARTGDDAEAVDAGSDSGATATRAGAGAGAGTAAGMGGTVVVAASGAGSLAATSHGTEAAAR